MKKPAFLKSIPVVQFFIVAVVAAVSFFIYRAMSAAREESGRPALGGLGFGLAVAALGGLAFMWKKARVIAAPLIMVGAVLTGIEATKRTQIGMGRPGLASRFRRGTGRPAASVAFDGMGRPAPSTGMARPAMASGEGVAGMASRAW